MGSILIAITKQQEKRWRRKYTETNDFVFQLLLTQAERNDDIVATLPAFENGDFHLGTKILEVFIANNFSKGGGNDVKWLIESRTKQLKLVTD